MTRPVQITFRHMEASPALEEDIRARAAWLETFYPSLVGCRVLVEIPHRKRGAPIHIRIELAVPGEDIVVSHQPTLHTSLQAGEAATARKGSDVNGAHKDALVAIHDAFDVARRRLEEAAQRQRGDVKRHRGVPEGQPES